MSRATSSTEPCARCGVNPRRPMTDTCVSCRHEITNEYFRERQRQKRAANPVEPKKTPCKCGCGRDTIYPVKYATDECKAKGNRAARDRDNKKRREKAKADHPERFGLKPHRPDPPAPRKVMSEEEAERLAAAASERDREINNRLVKKSLGLEVRKDCPLASEVVRPPMEVWKEYEANYKPLEQSEREFNLPLRADISYF